ncbi:MAG TPA: hypothetical protein VH595_22015 [Verrucomicrobiae bacterium]|nr:hypothetical protein [Verrucomicrobiae bacterium]
MPKTIFLCPHCSQKLRANSERINPEITCPKCQHTFIPESQTQPDEPAPALNANQFEDSSTNLRQLAFISVCAVLFLLGGAAWGRIEEKPEWTGWIWFAVVFIFAGVALWFASQLMAIRGQLHNIESRIG